MKTNILTISDFFDAHPECKGSVSVESRHGFYPIAEACVTARDEEVYTVDIDGASISGSKNHRLFHENGWRKIYELNTGDLILTKGGLQPIKNIKRTNKRMDLYDLQVSTVHEFYANGVVSHNSTICDSLVFCIFDSTLKNLKKTEIVNDVNKKKCEVSLTFDIEHAGKTDKYEIHRGISPAFCKLTINGEDKTKSGIPQTNAYIEDCLGVTKALFQQSIIMSIGNSRSFFDLKAAEKRAFIEGVFDLDIFSKMLADARSGANESKRDFDQYSMLLTSEQNNLQVLKDKEANFESNKAEFVAELVRSNTELEEKCVQLISNIADVPSFAELDTELSLLRTKVEKIDTALTSANNKLNTMEVEVRSIQSEVTRLSSVGDVCSKCGKPLDVNEVSARNVEISYKKSIIEDKKSTIETLKVKIQTVKDSKNTLNTQIEEKRQERSKITGIVEKNKLINGHIASLKQNIDSNNRRIEEKCSEVSSFADIIEKSKETIESTRLSVEKKKRENSAYETCKFILSEEGVKSVIIKELKTYLNAKLNSYLSLMNAPIRCEFDEYFDDTMYNQFDVQKSYDSLSGGEKRRMDMAILFTLQDMLKCRSGIDVRLAFYDEILDTSIDDSGRKQILDILKEKSQDSAIYIISHRPKMSELIDEEIVLEKHNGFTYRREDDK